MLFLKPQLLKGSRLTVPALLLALASAMAQVPAGSGNTSVMAEGYRKYWNTEVQKQIDADIDLNRKAEALLRFKKEMIGREVRIEQVSHDFLFGGNIFLFGDLKTPEKNKKYEDTFGALFNAATVPFYWKPLEPEEGKIRFAAGSSYEYRRPPSDPVVAFCESKGISMNGHAIIYGSRAWGHPTWMPDDRKKMEVYFENHVRKLAERYKGRIQRWDVVNEPTDQANRGVMPDDYTYKTFRWAAKYFPSSVQLNLNDSDMHWDMTLFRRYLEIVRNLIDRGIKMEYVGMQMHIFNPEESRKIAKGEDILTPKKVNERLDYMADAGLPLHVSEVTITAPDNTDEGKSIQAEITRNLYRLWFSHPKVMGITWWNVVDGGAATGEPSVSGLYDVDMRPKPVYLVLNSLLNTEWKTRQSGKIGNDGTLRFRGFKGAYRVIWKDAKGNEQQKKFYLKQDGDGFSE